MARRAKFDIELTPTALSCLRRVRNKKLRRALATEIDLLETEASDGKHLEGTLSGLVSRRAARDQWRIVYEIVRQRVVVHFLGRRAPGRIEDVYSIAARLLQELTAGGRSHD